MLAVKLGKLDLVQLLVEAGAKKDLADPDGFTAIGFAKKLDHSDIVTYLRKAGASE
jgi:ankyrin repeat protein